MYHMIGIYCSYDAKKHILKNWNLKKYTTVWSEPLIWFDFFLQIANQNDEAFEFNQQQKVLKEFLFYGSLFQWR